MEALAAWALTDFAHQLRASESAGVKAKERGAKLLLAKAYLQQGIALANTSRAALAKTRYEESRRLFEEAGSPAEAVQALNNVANILADEGDVAGARRLYGEFLSVARRTGDRLNAAVALDNIGLLERDAGELAAARAWRTTSRA